MNDCHGRCDSKENINTTLTLHVLLTRPYVRVARVVCARVCVCVGVGGAGNYKVQLYFFNQSKIIHISCMNYHE